jgi:hypothetical protein
MTLGALIGSTRIHRDAGLVVVHAISSSYPVVPAEFTTWPSVSNMMVGTVDISPDNNFGAMNHAARYR